MKSTILGFDQEGLVNRNMTIESSLILKWFIDYSSIGYLTVIRSNNEEYSLFDYEKIIESLPILKSLTENEILNLFDNLVEAQVMEKIIIKKKRFIDFGFKLSGEHYDLMYG